MEADQTLVTFSIQILDDVMLEGSESFSVHLQSEENYAQIDKGVVTIHIVDDDSERSSTDYTIALIH